MTSMRAAPPNLFAYATSGLSEHVRVRWRIGVLFFDDTQTTAIVLEQFPAVRHALVERLLTGSGAEP
jgi:hypothetical protein